MQQPSIRTACLKAQIAPDILALVKQAAAMQGRSVSDFVVAAAQEAASRTIAESHTIQLSADDQRRFVELLLNPPAPALERAKAAHAALFGSE